MLKVRAGFDFAMVLTQKRSAKPDDSETELYAIDFSRGEIQATVSRLFEGSENVSGNFIKRLGHIDTSILADFACGKESFVVVQDGNKSKSKDKNSIMHAWKESDDGRICEMPLTEYHMNLRNIPAVSIAIR